MRQCNAQAYKYYFLWMIGMGLLLLFSCSQESTDLSFVYHPSDKQVLANNIKREVSFHGWETDLSNIDISNMTDLSGLFSSDGDLANFNGDISSWNVSNVTDMSNMFKGNTHFNGDISSWNVSNVTDMSGMFAGATQFDQDISVWKVEKVKNMNSMFAGATQFNQDISTWKVNNTINNMINMFKGATGFKHDLEEWDIQDTIRVEGIFDNSGVTSVKLPGWSYVFTPSGNDAVTIEPYNGLPFIMAIADKDTDISVSFDANPSDISGRYAISPDINDETGLGFDTSSGTISGKAKGKLLQKLYTISFQGSGKYNGKSSSFRIWVSIKYTSK